MALEALKRNGHNLHLYGFETVGPYGIPSLEPVTLDGTFPFIPFNCAKTSTVRAGLGVHFFIDDYLFERVWHDPDRYAQMLSDFRVVMSPDFSLFTDYPVAVQLYNHWRKHLLGADQALKFQQIFEELCVQTIMPQMADDFRLQISVEYSDENSVASMRIRYSGDRFDPVERGDELSMMLVRSVAEDISYRAIDEDGYSSELSMSLVSGERH